LEASGSNAPNKEASLISSCFDLSLMQDPALLYIRHMWGACMGELKIDIRVEGSSHWTNIETVTGDQGNFWNAEIIKLYPYANEIVQFRITGTTGSCYTSDIALDGFWLYDYCQQNRFVTGNLNFAPNSYYVEAAQQVSSDAVLISGDFTYDSGQEIILYEGFEVKVGTTLTAVIDGCDSDPNSLKDSLNVVKEK